MISIPITQNYVSNDANSNVYTMQHQDHPIQKMQQNMNDPKIQEYLKNVQDLINKKCEKLQRRVTDLVKEKYVSKEQFMKTIYQDNEQQINKFSTGLLTQIASSLDNKEFNST